jgi:cell division septal protein FtsQ
MERSRRGGPKPAVVPAESRLTLRRAEPAGTTPRARKNRRRARSVWRRVQPRALADACGRAVRRAAPKALPALLATCILAVLAGGTWLGHRFLTTSERFAIAEIRIAGHARLTADEVRAALPIALGDNVFSADLDALAGRLRTHPWIASADIRRVLPATLVVELREHEPVAVVTLGERYLIDATGHPFKRAEPGDGEGLPLVTGLDRATYQIDPGHAATTIVAALDALAAWRAAGSRPAIAEVHITARGLALHARDHELVIELAASRSHPELIARLGTFDAAWADLDDTLRARAREIHLGTRPDLVTVASAPEPLPH